MYQGVSTVPGIYFGEQPSTEMVQTGQLGGSMAEALQMGQLRERGPEASQLWGHHSPLRASGLHWPFCTAAGEGSQSITPKTFNLCSLTPGISTLSWGGALPSLLGPSGLRALPNLLELSDTPQVTVPFEEHGLVPMAKFTIMGHAAGSATLEVRGGYSPDGAPGSLHRTRGGPCQAANIPRPCLGLWHYMPTQALELPEVPKYNMTDYASCLEQAWMSRCCLGVWICGGPTNVPHMVL